MTRILIALLLLEFAPECLAIGFEGEAAPEFHDDEFIDASPGLGLFALFAILILLVLLGAGVVFGIVACGIAAALVGLGILSASAVYGILRRSTASGFRAMFLLCGAVGGFSAGIGVATIGTLLFKSRLDGISTPAIGGLIGLALGGLIAWAFNFVLAQAIVRRPR